jgi:hypothetical protein
MKWTMLYWLVPVANMLLTILCTWTIEKMIKRTEDGDTKPYFHSISRILELPYSIALGFASSIDDFIEAMYGIFTPTYVTHTNRMARVHKFSPTKAAIKGFMCVAILIITFIPLLILSIIYYSFKRTKPIEPLT